MKKVGLFILMIGTLILFNGCSNYKEIENRKVSTCFFDGKVGDSYCYTLYYNSKQYFEVMGGVEHMLIKEDKFVVLFDSVGLNSFYPLFFMPVLDPAEEYDTATAGFVSVNRHKEPLFKETFYNVTFGFRFDDNFGNDNLVLRGQVLRIDERTEFLEKLKEGDKIKIIYKMGNPYKCFIKLDNYYLTDPSQYRN